MLFDILWINQTSPKVILSCVIIMFSVMKEAIVFLYIFLFFCRVRDRVMMAGAFLKTKNMAHTWGVI